MAVNHQGNTLTITFDDGPDDKHVPVILDILQHYGVPATFFCIGEHVSRHPDVLLRMLQQGHTVANHSWNHPHLTQLSDADIEWQLESTSKCMQEVTGLRPRFFRPPYGNTDARVENVARCLSYQTVLWDVDSVDWSGISGPEIAANVLPKLRSGAIILHHSSGNVAGTVEALPYIIEVAKAMNYTFIKLEELTGAAPYV